MRSPWTFSLGIVAVCFACAGESKRSGSTRGDTGADAGEGVGNSAGTSGGSSGQGGSASGSPGSGGVGTAGTGMGGVAPATGGNGDTAGSMPMAGGAGVAGDLGGAGAGGAGSGGAAPGGSGAGGTAGRISLDVLDTLPECPLHADRDVFPPIAPLACTPDQSSGTMFPWKGCYYSPDGCLCTESAGSVFCTCVHPDSDCASGNKTSGSITCELGETPIGSTIGMLFCGCSETGFYCGL